jgi:hypothetical protein
VARVHNGYLTDQGVPDPQALVAALEANFERICVGVHDDAQVVLGYGWDGRVEGSEQRRIGQVFTSTVAGGGYGGERLGPAFEAAARQLLRAAYLGTLLAAATLGRTRVVLTLIGGGVFGNPIPLIWEAILWALAEAERVAPRDLDVFVNGRRDLIGAPPRRVGRVEVLAAVRGRGGAIVEFDGQGRAVALQR